MRIRVPHGRQLIDLDLEPGRLLAHLRGPPPLSDPAAAVRDALETPLGFPPLRRALTPGDHVAVVVDERLPDLAALLVPVLEHITSAGVDGSTIALVCASGGGAPGWVDELPDEFDDVHVEVHDPKERQRLAYLATTKAGRRLYLNRTVVDADQVVVLTGRRYDALLGHGGAEGDLFPALADEATRAQAAEQAPAASGAEPSPLRREAVEVIWLLGQPFFVQLIPSAGDGVAHVVAGAIDTTREGQQLLDTGWHKVVARRADTVLVGLSGDPSRHSFADLATAAAAASRAVRPGGRVILLGDVSGALGPGVDVLLRHDGPQEALAELEKAAVPGHGPAVAWARTAAHARLALWSNLPTQTVEDLFAAPLAGPDDVGRLLAAGGECLVVDDGHRQRIMVE